MDSSVLPQVDWLIVLLIAAWAVVMCLLAIGREVEHAEAVHKLRIDAKVLQNEYRRRVQQRVDEARRRVQENEKRRAERRAAELEKRAEEHAADAAVADAPDSTPVADRPAALAA